LISHCWPNAVNLLTRHDLLKVLKMENSKNFDNILLLSIEDLNDWVGPLGGHPQAYTPNIDKLARRSTVFEHAFAAAPACSPSRTSTLFGKAPWHTGIYHNRQSWAMAFPPGKQFSIIGQARKSGWDTIGAGKIFHTGSSGLDEADWSNYFHTPRDVFLPFSRAVSTGKLGLLSDFGVLNEDAPSLYDERNLDFFKNTLKKGDRKKFWAFGTFRPHLPFIVKQKYFDLIHQPVEMPPSFNGVQFNPKNMNEFEKLPPEAKKIIDRGMGNALARTDEYNLFLHSYLASIAFADSIIGELLDHMETLGLLKNTLIVFWSDHGWQLGEKLAFRKFTLWERALRVPLMISIPDGTTGRVSEPVSLLDIYPTLLNFIGESPPYNIDGQDLTPLIYGGEGRGFSQSMWERFQKKPEEKSFLALTVRTGKYRLIQYHDDTLELYDHEKDPFEKDNLLTDCIGNMSSNIQGIVADLIAKLPRDAVKPLSSASLPMNLETRHISEAGRKFIS